MLFSKATIFSAVFFGAAIISNIACSSLYPDRFQEEQRVVPARPVAEILCVDQRGAMADYLLALVTIHTGSLMWKPAAMRFDGEWGFRVIDLVTDLDPEYMEAYLFAGLAMIHTADDVRRARPILEKGMAAFPDNWELPYWIGYAHYLHLEDFDTATEYLGLAARKPGAPTRFLGLFAQAAKKSGSYESGRWALQAMLATTENPQIRLVYMKKLKQLDNLIGLQEAVGRFHRDQGIFPERLTELLEAGLLDELPRDPYEMTYVWDTASGKVVAR